MELEELPNANKISVFEVANVPTVIGKFSINYEMTTPKSCHRVKIPMETQLHLSLGISFLFR